MYISNYMHIWCVYNVRVPFPSDKTAKFDQPCNGTKTPRHSRHGDPHFGIQPPLPVGGPH